MSNVNNLNERNEYYSNYNLSELHNMPADPLTSGNTIIATPTPCLGIHRTTLSHLSSSIESRYAVKYLQQEGQLKKSSLKHYLTKNSEEIGAGGEVQNHQPYIFEAGSKQASHANRTSNIPTAEDEISKSLIRFAFWTAFENNSESSPLSAVDDVMQDFANNGYVSDDINGNNSFNAIESKNVNSDSTNLYNCTSYCTENSIDLSQFNCQVHPTLQDELNFSINVNINIWRMLRPNAKQVQQYKSSNTSTGSKLAASTKSDQSCTQRKQSKRRSITKNDKHTAAKYCVFCENNNEPETVVKSHVVRDSMGRVLCPRLRLYICPICKASGDMAHTIKYCPQKPIVTMEDSIRSELLRLAKINRYKQQIKQK